jgi:hypothetical protein
VLIVMSHAARQLPAWLIFDVRQKEDAPHGWVRGALLGFVFAAQITWIDVCGGAAAGDTITIH